MCLAIPGQIVEKFANDSGVLMAKTKFGGVVKRVCLEYTPEVEIGDYVLVHVGFALSKVDAEEAEKTYQILEQMDQLDELETPQLEGEGEPQ